MNKQNNLDLNLFSELINYSNDMVFILNMSEFKFEYINKTACDELGYTFDEMQALGVGGFRKSLPDSCTFQEHLDELKNEKEGITDHAIVVKKDGSEIYIETKARIVNVNNVDYNIALVRDITENVELIEKLKVHAQRTQHYLDIAKVLIMALDYDKNVIMINQEGADMLGYPKDEIIGENWIDKFLPKHTQEEIYEVADNIINKKDNHNGHVNAVLTKNGEELLVLWKSTPLLDDDGNSIGVLTSGEDITEKRARENQLFVQNKHAQMGEMIGMIAHQWRQPLGAISASVIGMQIQKELGCLDSEHLDAQLVSINEYTQHLSETIDDFRGYFKDDKSESKTTLEDIVATTLKIIETTVTNNNISISTEFKCNKIISTYPNELRQVLLSLINNAKEAIFERNIKNASIIIKTYMDEEKYCVEVMDNAGGIDENLMDKIFNPYFTTKGELNGTGLGLYMSKKIIEEHCSGTIEAKNKDDGTSFVISLSYGE